MQDKVIHTQQQDEFNAWLDGLLPRLPDAARSTLQTANALLWAEAGRQSLDITPHIPHARDIIEILSELHLDADSLVAAYLCAVPQVKIAFETLEKELGKSIAELVGGVRKLSIVEMMPSQRQDSLKDEKSHLEGLRNLLLGMAEDIRMVLIKLAERVQIMRELKTQPDETRRRVARETMDIFAPLANRLGIWQLKWELEDLSFRFLEPEHYKRIASLLDERRVDRELYIVNMVARLHDELARAGIEAEVVGRPKHIYSIWKKMMKKHLDFHDLFDVRALRVLVNDVAACYTVLGIAHTLWKPIPSEFDDYIASPKENNYQSLHTAVVGPAGKTLEIQIRTHDMHQHSEYGVAAHWGYKEGGQQGDAYRERIAWLRQILEWRDEEQGTEDFIDRFKSEVFQDRVYVLTPAGKVIDLPRGATPLDFAYHIHTDVGHRYRGAKVDGKMVPIRYELKNGEQVEILTAKSGTPSRDWINPSLGYLRSSRARGKARSWFRQQDFDKNVAHGRHVVDRELHRLGLTSVNLEQVAKRFESASLEAFLASIGSGDITSAQIAARLKDLVLPEQTMQVPATPRRRQVTQVEDEGEITIHGVGDLMTHLAHCCKPVPYDQIIGYITRGRGITIHRRDCPNALRLQSQERERFIEVEWSQGASNAYSVDIQVRAYDRQGLLRDITEVLSNDQVNVTAINTQTDRRSHIASMILSLDVQDIDQLSRALVKIEQLPNVLEASRKVS